MAYIYWRDKKKKLPGYCKPDYVESTMAEIGLDLDFEIENFEEEVESESMSSSSGPESNIDEGELGDDDKSNAPQAANGVVPE